METVKQLRHMHAAIKTFDKDIEVVVPTTNQRMTLASPIMLRSYGTLVAIYGKVRQQQQKPKLFLLPKYDASRTTWKHLHAFVTDHCTGIEDMSAKDMRLAANAGVLELNGIRHNTSNFSFAKYYLSPDFPGALLKS